MKTGVFLTSGYKSTLLEQIQGWNRDRKPGIQFKDLNLRDQAERQSPRLIREEGIWL